MTTITMEEFKEFWYRRGNYGHIELNTNDKRIQEKIQYYLSKYSLAQAADLVADYIVSQGLGEVVE